MERQVTFYYGSSEREEMCQAFRASVTAFVKKKARHSRTKKYAAEVIQAMLKSDDAKNCIKANEREFDTIVGLPVEDLGLLLQYQEDLIYKCQKWAN